MHKIILKIISVTISIVLILSSIHISEAFASMLSDNGSNLAVSINDLDTGDKLQDEDLQKNDYIDNFYEILEDSSDSMERQDEISGEGPSSEYAQKILPGDSFEPDSMTSYRPRKGGFIVRFKGDVNRSQANRILNSSIMEDRVKKNKMGTRNYSSDESRFKVERTYGKTAVVTVEDGENADSIIQILTEDPTIEYISPDYILRDLSGITSMEVNDTIEIKSDAFPDNRLDIDAIPEGDRIDIAEPAQMEGRETDEEGPAPADSRNTGMDDAGLIKGEEIDEDDADPTESHAADEDEPALFDDDVINEDEPALTDDQNTYEDESLSTEDEGIAANYAKQWALCNYGQEINGRDGTVGVDIGLTSAPEDKPRQSEIVIAVLDTGININHESLQGKITDGFNFVNYGENVYNQNDGLHGTQIAAIIAADSENISGAALNVTIMPLKFMQDGFGYTSDALAAIQFARENNVKIINCSWGSAQFNPLLKAAIEDNSDILFVCAAGNNGNGNPVYPAAYDLPNVVSVTAMDNTGTLADFSNYGPKVDIAAPGQDIYTVVSDNEYGFVSGTSMAAPYVSAAAGIYLGAYPDIPAARLKALIVSAAKPYPALAGLVKSGGYLHIANMFAVNISDLTIDYDDNNTLEKEYMISPEVRAILYGKTSYRNLDDFEKDLLKNTFWLRDETMLECSDAGFSIKDSVMKAIIMQRLDISFSETQDMISYFGDDEEAYSQTEYLRLIRQSYLWFNNEGANGLTKWIAQGYPAHNTVFSFVIAQAFGMEHSQIISKSIPSIEEMDTILKEWEDDETSVELFKGLIRIYCVDPAILAEYIRHSGMTVQEFYNSLIAFEKENGLFASAVNAALSVADFKGIDPPRSAFIPASDEEILMADGSLNYYDNIAVIPGRGGLDLNLALRYNSGESSTLEAYSTDYVNKTRNIRVLSALDYVANGWKFAFPYVCVPQNTNTEPLVYKAADGTAYEYDSSTSSHLKNHKTSDIIFDTDTNNQYNGSQYCLTYSNGTKEYFDGAGKLIAIIDRFGNKITFVYNSSTVTITDTLSQVTTISKTSTALTVTLPGGGVVKYDLELNTVSQSSGNASQFHLKKKTDQLNRITTYTYEARSLSANPLSGYTPPKVLDTSPRTFYNGPYAISYGINVYGYVIFNTVIGATLYTCSYTSSDTDNGVKYSVSLSGHFWGVECLVPYVAYPGLVPVYVDYALLKTVSYPTGAQTSYDYTNYDVTQNGGIGSYKYPRVTIRKDTSEGSVYNNRSYAYTGNIPVNLLTTTVTYPDSVKKIYETTNQLLTSIKLQSSNIIRFSDTYTYDSNRQKATYYYTVYNQSGTAVQTAKELFIYDGGANLTQYWGKQALGSSTNTEFKTTFTYGNYAQLLTKTYKQNANTTITVTNTLSADKKTITSAQISSSSGGVISKSDFTYDSYGNTLTEKKYINASQTITTTYTYQNGVFLKSESTGGVTKQYTYDLYGRVLTAVDGNDKKTSFLYDAAGRLTKTTNPDSSTSTAAYNDTAKTMEVTNEIGNIIKTTYNGLGYPLTVEDVTGTAFTLHTSTYDSQMRLQQEKDAGDTVTVYTYDFLDRVLTKTIGGTAYKETYEYDDTNSGTLSKVTKTINGETNAPSIKTVVYTNIYGFPEKTGRVISNAEQLTICTFDYLGNQLTSKTPDNITTAFQYDGANRLIKTTNPDGSVYQNSYDWLGRKITSTDPKGAVTNFTYDSLDRLTIEESPFTGNYKTAKTYQYDNNGNITSQRQSNNKPGAAASESRIDYVYNNRNFLTKVNNYNQDAVENYITYTYDTAGNKLSMATKNGKQTVTYVYDKQSRLIKMTDPMGKYETYAYDNNNNLITKTDRMNTVITNGYDALNRLISVTAKKNGTTAATEYMAYTYYKTGAVKQEKNESLTSDFIYDADIIGLN